MTNVLEGAQNNIREAAKFLDITPDVIEILCEPQRVLESNLNIKMDNGTNKVFKSFRSQHNNACGPYKGGLRYHPNVTLEEVKALSIWMSLKCQVVGIPYGGAKGGICVNPSDLSEVELEKLTRAYVNSISENIGVDKDIPAPDVNTNGKIMSWIVDEYSKINSKLELGIVTGKPIELGGSLGRLEATGFGVVEVTKEYLKNKNIDKSKARISVQGFGNVGSNTCSILYKEGIKIVSIAGHNKNGQFAIYKEEGIDIPRLIEFRKNEKDMTKFEGVEIITMDNFWSLNVDVLIPAALENEIKEDNASSINAKCIIEAANGPVTTEADRILEDKNIDVIPDILANSGGVIVSYFEWIQNRTQDYWTEDLVFEKASKQIIKAFSDVWKFKEDNHIPSYRKAAYAFSISRIVKAMNLRGWI